MRGIFTYNQGNPPIQQWIRESKKLLIINDNAKKIGEQMQVGWRQPKNIQRLVCGTAQGGSKNTQTVEDAGCCIAGLLALF